MRPWGKGWRSYYRVAGGCGLSHGVSCLECSFLDCYLLSCWTVGVIKTLVLNMICSIFLITAVVVLQIAMLKNSCKVALKELKHWIAPEKVCFVWSSSTDISWYSSFHHTIFSLMQVKTSLTSFPSSAEIVSEPLGVVLVISAWNYPFCMLIFSWHLPFFFPLKLYLQNLKWW